MFHVSFAKACKHILHAWSPDSLHYSDLMKFWDSVCAHYDWWWLIISGRRSSFSNTSPVLTLKPLWWMRTKQKHRRQRADISRWETLGAEGSVFMVAHEDQHSYVHYVHLSRLRNHSVYTWASDTALILALCTENHIYCLWKSLFCSLQLHVLDQKHSKNSEILL